MPPYRNITIKHLRQLLRAKARHRRVSAHICLAMGGRDFIICTSRAELLRATKDMPRGDTLAVSWSEDAIVVAVRRAIVR